MIHPPNSVDVHHGPLLLSGIDRGPGLAAHRARLGAPPERGIESLVAMLGEVGVRGRGGAGFPLARKLQTVAQTRGPRAGLGSRRPYVVVNAAEGEPASGKDTALMVLAPHRVLDGATMAAHALGTRDVHVVTPSERPAVGNAVAAAVAERRRSGEKIRWTLHAADPGFVSGQARAVIELMSGRPNLPVTAWQPEAVSGFHRRATLLSNAETFAQLAIGARIGPERYGNTGLYDEPGTVMLTVSGAVARPMVIEVPTGVPLRYVLQLAGAPPVPQGVLTGGYHGKWIDAATVNEAVVSRNSLDAVGGALGAGAILPISQETCPLGESLRVAQWLAEESAGQCGPCYLGLPAASRGLEDIINGGGPAALEALKQVAKNVKRRGACSHPDGSAMFLESTIKAFTDDLAAHVLGNGCGRPVEGVLPLFEGGRTPTGIPGGAEAEESGPSRQKIYVDWTLCRGHGLCADILPEVFELGADGFPTVAQAQVPRYAEAKALRAVRRCPALALRLEEETARDKGPSRNLPVLSQGRGRRALGR